MKLEVYVQFLQTSVINIKLENNFFPEQNVSLVIKLDGVIVLYNMAPTVMHRMWRINAVKHVMIIKHTYQVSSIIFHNFIPINILYITDIYKCHQEW